MEMNKKTLERMQTMRLKVCIMPLKQALRTCGWKT